jgi:xanthine/uracil permease
MSKIIYGLNENPRGRVLWLSSMQWFVFTIANIITVPIVLGHAFGLQEYDIALMTSRTLLLSGLIGLLQVLFGHKLPIIEGPASMWWGVFLVLLQLNQDAGKSNVILLRELEWGLIAGSMVFIILSLSGLLSKIRILFTPAITGTFLILLALQVSKSLLEGVLGIGFHGSTTVKTSIILMSLILIGLNIGLMRKGKGILQNISVLISLLVGWGLYAMLGMVTFTPFSAQLIALPQLFPFGPPVFNWGVVLTSAITSVILMSNFIASVQVISKLAKVQVTNKVYSRGVFISGIGTLLTGCFGTVGIVPLTSGASLVAFTGIASRLPFLLSSAIIAIVGLVPSAGQLLATIPAPVGYAVLFTVFGQMIGFGLRDIQTLSLDQRDIFVVGFSILAGVGSLFIQGKAWADLPALFGFVFGNGLIVGVVIAILLEHLVFRKNQGTTKKNVNYKNSQAEAKNT